MIRICGELREELRERLPETYDLLSDSNLTVHEAVRAVVLSGSRGPRGGFRPDSDIDLSLLVDTDALRRAPDAGGLLEEVIGLTLGTWKSPVELDTVAVFDKLSCGLRCFQLGASADLRCDHREPDCVGLYKTQKGFHGFVPDIGVTMEKVYPMMLIWGAGL